MTEPLVESGHVLVVDERGLLTELARTFLEQAGYRISHAETREAALELFAPGRVGVVLMALAAPDDAVTEIYRELRAQPNARLSAFVFVLEREQPSLRQRAFELAVDDCLVQPLQRTELLLCVRSLAGLSHDQSPDARALELMRRQRDELLLLQRRREETAALLVHDMKNPLAGVISNAEFLVTASGLDSEQHDCATDILQASRRLHRMVLSLLDVSHSEHGALIPVLRPVELTALVREAQGTCSSRLRDKELTLRLALPEGPVQLHADRDMVLRLLANLLDNATRSSPIGHEIALSVSPCPGGVELRVSDQGPGIPQAMHAQLFESYAAERRSEEPSARLRPRKNLGLSACRVLAEAHGGRIWVENPGPRGATLCVFLPRPGL